MPRTAGDRFDIGYDDDLFWLTSDPSTWTAEQIMASTPEVPLPVEERVRRALEMFHFRVTSIQAMPIHNIVVVSFQARQSISLHPQSLARVMRIALAHHAVPFDRGSVAVGGAGRRGQVAFVLTEPLDGG